MKWWTGSGPDRWLIGAAGRRVRGLTVSVGDSRCWADVAVEWTLVDLGGHVGDRLEGWTW